jgi:hypothetical protein
MSKSKISQMKQIHGKQEKDFQPTTLNQIWGDDGMDKYSTMSEEEYLNQLNEMNATDLQRHSVKVGIVPDHKIDIMKKRLLNAFRTHVSSYRKPVFIPQKAKISNAAKKILSEGR